MRPEGCGSGLFRCSCKTLVAQAPGHAGPFSFLYVAAGDLRRGLKQRTADVGGVLHLALTAIFSVSQRLPAAVQRAHGSQACGTLGKIVGSRRCAGDRGEQGHDQRARVAEPEGAAAMGTPGLVPRKRDSSRGRRVQQRQGRDAVIPGDRGRKR